MTGTTSQRYFPVYMSNSKKIEAFHDNDNKTRVIWWYGPVIKNNSDSNTPEVLILTRLLTEDNTLTDNIQMLFSLN